MIIVDGMCLFKMATACESNEAHWENSMPLLIQCKHWRTSVAEETVTKCHKRTTLHQHPPSSSGPWPSLLASILDKISERFGKRASLSWPSKPGRQAVWKYHESWSISGLSTLIRWNFDEHQWTIQPYNTATSRFMTVYSLKKLEALLHIPYISILYSRHDQFAFFCCWHLSNRMNWGIEFHLSRLCAPMKEMFSASVSFKPRKEPRYK